MDISAPNKIYECIICYAHHPTRLRMMFALRELNKTEIKFVYENLSKNELNFMYET